MHVVLRPGAIGTVCLASYSPPQFPQESEVCVSTSSSKEPSASHQTALACPPIEPDDQFICTARSKVNSAMLGVQGNQAGSSISVTFDTWNRPAFFSLAGCLGPFSLRAPRAYSHLAHMFTARISLGPGSKVGLNDLLDVDLKLHF